MQTTYSINLKQLETKVRLGYHHLYLSLVKGERDLKLGDAAEVANALDLTLDEFHDALRRKLFRALSRSFRRCLFIYRPGMPKLLAPCT